MKLFINIGLCLVPLFGGIYLFYKCIDDDLIYDLWEYIALSHVLIIISITGGL